MKDLRIVFMGTPDFAVGVLDSLVKKNYTVVAVITAPDKPAGRGRKLQQSAIKKYALEHQLTVLQPENLKQQNFLDVLKSLHVNLQIIVAFRMLPKVVWQMPNYGTFNLHASLLPAYRGAAPINWAIINGDTKTGVTTFFIDEKIDTGELILQDEVSISETENVGDLHDKLMIAGSNLVLKTVKLIEKGNVKTTKQAEHKKSLAPKIFKDTCKIDWTSSLESIYNKIRGLSPYPAAWSVINNNDKNIEVKIFKATKESVQHNFTIGKIISTKTALKIAVNGGYLYIESLQLSGKKRMLSKDLLNGYTFSEDSKML